MTIITKNPLAIGSIMVNGYKTYNVISCEKTEQGYEVTLSPSKDYSDGKNTSS